MKILLITDHHSLQGGGAEKQFFILKELLKNQSDITVFSLGFGQKASHGDDFFVLRETPSKALRQVWRMFVNPVKYLQLRALIHQIDPDVIHLHNIKKYTPSLLKAIKGYPSLQTIHDFSPICPTQWNVHKNLEPCKTGFSLRCFLQHRRTYNIVSYFALLFSFYRMRKDLKKSVSQFMTPSPLLADYLTKHRFSNASHIFPFHTKQLASNKEPKHGHFLFLGQLEKQKGIHFLLHEFYLATQKNNQLILTIAGNGSEKNNLKEKIKQLGLEKNVRMIDWCNNPSELYQQCAAVIFPSIGLESFGLVMLEAMTHGRAVIGSNRGPTPWLVEHEKTGLLFDPLKEGNLSSCMLKLSDHESSLAKTLGENGWKKSQEFADNNTILFQTMEKYHSSIKDFKK